MLHFFTYIRVKKKLILQPTQNEQNVHTHTEVWNCMWVRVNTIYIHYQNLFP